MFKRLFRNAQWFYNLSISLSYSKIKIQSIDEVFEKSCKTGNLAMAKWLINISNEFYDPIFLEVGFKLACENNQVEIAKWLTTFNNYHIEINKDIITGWKINYPQH